MSAESRILRISLYPPARYRERPDSSDIARGHMGHQRVRAMVARANLPTYMLARSRPFAAWHRRKRPLIAELARSLLHSGTVFNSTVACRILSRARVVISSRLAVFRTVRPFSVSKSASIFRPPFVRPSLRDVSIRASTTDRTFARTSDYFDRCA